MRWKLGLALLLSLSSSPALVASSPRSLEVPTPAASLRGRIEREVSAALTKFAKRRDDEKTWAVVRGRVSDVMQGFFREGALKGTKPELAYWVRCGRDTMTENDIQQGRLVVLVGYAPVAPAKFEVLRLSQAIQPGS